MEPTFRNFGGEAPKIIENLEKDKAILYTYRQMDGLRKGYGYITTDEVTKIDLENNKIYYTATNVRSLGVGEDIIDYEQLFVFGCSLQVITALLKLTDS